eukprot:CAMPEP_0196730776 /NCGR_PEP_ID=MMETSP1091-20130531/10739_1 /TAXON_ID=302021 /ORGANISM="Rhodomonas sp., Strain CCMP768" /LENGTH=97 /DNA_ID=CAMNT_0042073841 /DNA_START=15 /DNA_END=305 /DNA_ORIENTATION=-
MPSMTASPTTEVTKIAGPAWDNGAEYTALDDPAILEDLDRVKTLTDVITMLTQKIDLDALDTIDGTILVEVTKKSMEARILLANVGTFASCETSVDA